MDFRLRVNPYLPLNVERFHVLSLPKCLIKVYALVALDLSGKWEYHRPELIVSAVEAHSPITANETQRHE